MLSRLACWIWGHAVQNEVYQHGERACTRCGRPMLHDDGAATRSSFVGAGAARSSGGP